MLKEWCLNYPKEKLLKKYSEVHLFVGSSRVLLVVSVFKYYFLRICFTSRTNNKIRNSVLYFGTNFKPVQISVP